MKAIFDCDGVLLDSNALKVEAFRRTLVPHFDEAVVASFLDHHRRHGGVSRYVKFERLVTAEVPERERPGLLDELLTSFSRECIELYAESSLTEGALECLDWLGARATLYVASGSDEDELRTVFATRGLASRFEAVYGSPTPKDHLVRRIVSDLGPAEKAFFVGDAVKDFEAARSAFIPCVLMRRYSDAPDAIRDLAAESGSVLIEDLRELPSVVESGALWC